MPWMAAVGAGSAIIGDLISSSGQQSTNEASQAIANANNATAIQLAQNAMQYRVADYKKAGLNPMLAAGGPGMTVPNLQQPQLQNPGSSFGQMGQQVMQAQQTAANVRATNAQAALTESQTPSGDVIPVDSDGHIHAEDILNSPHGGMLGKLNAAQMVADIDKTNATIDNLRSTTDVNKAVEQLRMVDLGVAKQSAAAIVSKAVSDAGIAGADLSIEQAQAKVLGGPMGPAIQAIKSILGDGFLGKILGAAVTRPSVSGSSGFRR